MHTVFISANDTGSGKTYVTAALACHLLLRKQRVQVVKVVETGVTVTTPAEQTDAGFVKAFAAYHAPARLHALDTITLQHFATPLAPVDAALLDGKKLSFDALVNALASLPSDADWRLVEGAGGLAVPLGEPEPDAASSAHPQGAPRDWADFALAIHADTTLLVVEDRLGAINQARLLAAYAAARGLPQAGLWLNQVQPDADNNVRHSNARALQAGAAAISLWAIHNHGALWPQNINAPWLK